MSLGLVLLLFIYAVDFNLGIIIRWLINVNNKQISKRYVEMKCIFKCFAELELSVFNRLQSSNVVNKKTVDKNCLTI